MVGLSLVHAVSGAINVYGVSAVAFAGQLFGSVVVVVVVDVVEVVVVDVVVVVVVVGGGVVVVGFWVVMSTGCPAKP